MSDIRKLAVAIAFLEGVEAHELIENRFSQDDRNLFYEWFIEKWNTEWDKEMMNEYLDLIENKINELKGEQHV